MSDVDWEAEDFVPPARVPLATDLWKGEDEDAEVKDNWDEEEDEEQAKPTDNGETGSAVQTKKKRSLKEIIAEKEEKKRKELEEKKKLEEEEMVKPLSAAELSAEKLRQQKLQEESDLILAVEAFGVAPVDPSARGIIDGMEPTSKEDFEKFEEVLREKITKFEKSPHYVPFLENLYRQLAIDLDPEDIKRLGSTLTALSNEKNKQQKGPKGKKKKQKATINVGKDTDDTLVVEGGYDDYDDFI